MSRATPRDVERRMRVIHALGEFVALASAVLGLALLRFMLPQAAVERQR